jgi:hypothetical protein
MGADFVRMAQLAVRLPSDLYDLIRRLAGSRVIATFCGVVFSGCAVAGCSKRSGMGISALETPAAGSPTLFFSFGCATGRFD